MSNPDARTPSMPETMRAFVLNGTGLGHAAVRRIPTPTPGPWQLVGRVDAAAICSSVNKVIAQGPGHSLMYGRDLAAHPAVLGDEGVITVVAVGDGVDNRFPVAERYAVQPAVDVPPVTDPEWHVNGGTGVRKVALGYTLPGLLARARAGAARMTLQRRSTSWSTGGSTRGCTSVTSAAWNTPRTSSR